MIAIGDANDIHEYLRINAIRGGISSGENAWFIAVSRNYIDPYQYMSDSFESIQAMDTLAVYRNNKVVEYAFVFYLKNYQKD